MITNIIYDYLVTCIDDTEIKALIEKLQDYLYNGGLICNDIKEEQVIKLIDGIKEQYNIKGSDKMKTKYIKYKGFTISINKTIDNQNVYKVSEFGGYHTLKEVKAIIDMWEDTFPTLENILQNHFGLKGNMFLKRPKAYGTFCGETQYQYMTDKAIKSYSKLIKLIYSLNELVEIENLNEIIDKLDDLTIKGE